MGNKSKAKGKATSNPSAGATASSAHSLVRSRRDAPTPKRQREESDDFETSTEVDPEILVDSLLACLIKNESLLNGFIEDLFKIPMIQDKIVTQVLNVLKDTPTENIVNHSVKTVTHDLNDTIKELSGNVKQLTDELKSSKSQCDELEQYSRRNNIVISGIPEDNTTSCEKLACSFLNQYVDSGIDPRDVDRAHRITRASNRQPGNRKPRDIIVKFCSYRSKAAILTRGPMTQLRADNLDKSPNDRIYVREDLTKSRNSILYKTRVLKRAKLIKDTYSKDGRIVVKLLTDRFFYLTCEDDFKEFCSKEKIKFADPKTTGSGPRRVTESTETTTVVSMDTVTVEPAGNLDPEAAVFTPAQSLLSPMTTPMAPKSQLPSSQKSPSQSLFKSLNQ